MAVFAYACVDADVQADEDPRAAIETAGFHVDRWFADPGSSVCQPASRRPHFAAMLRELKDGDTLVVSRLHFLGDSARSIEAALDLIAERNVQFVILQLGLTDLNSAAGQPVRAMLAAIAELDVLPLWAPAVSALAPASRQRDRRGKTTAEQRAAIVTEYSHGASVTELVRRHKLSRAVIQAIVAPRRSQENEPLPIGWGD